MGPKVGRKKTHHGIRDVKRAKKTKAKTRDLDQIFNDMEPINYQKLSQQPVDADLPGFGQFYCVQCARHFINSEAKLDHLKTKAHKKRVKTLANDTAYTQKEAEAAVGLLTDNGPNRK
jgi:bud site selection protein 20